MCGVALNIILAEVFTEHTQSAMRPVVYIWNCDDGGLSDIKQVSFIRINCSDWRTHYDIKVADFGVLA